MQQKYYYFVSLKSKGLYKTIIPVPVNVPKPYKEISEGDYKRFCLQLTRSPEYEMGFDNFGNPKVVHFSENINVSELKEKIANFHIESINDINKNHIISYGATEIRISSPVFQLLESCFYLGEEEFEPLRIKNENGSITTLLFSDIKEILKLRNKLLRKINDSKIEISKILQNSNDKNKLLDTYKQVKYKDFIK